MNYQSSITDAVAERGYLENYTHDEICARQIVKEVEELCEAAQYISTDDPALLEFLLLLDAVGQRARNLFDFPLHFTGTTVNTLDLQNELADMVVPMAVLATYAGVDDMMELALKKATADVSRGVRNGKTAAT